MDAQDMQENWTQLGAHDPFYVILRDPAKEGEKWDRDEFFETGQREIERVFAYLNSLGVSPGTRRALDFGCGVGRLTQALAERFDEVDGVDISASMIELANRYNRHGQRCHYAQNGAVDLRRFPDQHFDFIYTNITLQHIEPHHSLRYISEFCRTLTPRGIVLFQVPDRRAMAHPLTERLRGYVPPVMLPPLVKLYRLARTGSVRGRPWPRIEMHGIRQGRVLSLLQRRGMQVLDVTDDTDAGMDWISFRYCASKPARDEE